MTLKKEKGITLIALIITIIVMLILVGVTINVALNGGLFTKASDASKQMQIEADKEELLSAVVAAIGTDGKVVLADIELPTGWSGENGTYTSPKDNTFTVDENGKITYTGENIGGGNEPIAFDWSSVGLDNVDTSKEYKGYIELLDMTVIISFSEDGKVIIEENGYITEIDATNPDNIDETTENLKFSLIISGTNSNIVVTMNENDTDIDAEIEGLGTITYEKQENNKTIYSNKEVLKRLGITNYTGTYEGTWTVIGTEGNKTKLVSTSNVAYGLYFGYRDLKAIEAIPAAGSEPTEEEKLERAIWSYKNAVSTLDTAAQDATGITNARSINIGDMETLLTIEKGTNNGKEYTYDYTNHKDQVFVTESGETVVIDSKEKEVTLKDTSYTATFSEDGIGIFVNGNCWIASPYVRCWSYGANYSILFTTTTGINDTGFFASSNTMHVEDRGAYGVRAVVSI